MELLHRIMSKVKVEKQYNRCLREFMDACPYAF